MNAPTALQASDFDYPLDPARIAQSPPADRDRARLLVLNRSTGQTAHRRFSDLPGLLRDGDLMVVNDTRVVPAKFFCRRQTGGRIEGLFLSEPRPGRWLAMLKNAGRCHGGEVLRLRGADDVQLRLAENRGQGQWLLDVLAADAPAPDAEEILHRAGATPLPPYIRRPADGAREADDVDRRRYQTVYAAQNGAVAAPTAGLHFTEPLLAELRRKGVRIAAVTLHVGLGTFAPVKTDDLAAHAMHREWYQMPAETARALNQARADGRRIVAVGTTSVRVLETLAAAGDEFRPADGWTDLFLYPPAEFRAVGALITNFHLPRSTLVMLVAAFCTPGRTDGRDMILETYAEAARRGYRFYSYGDAMLIE